MLENDIKTLLVIGKCFMLVNFDINLSRKYKFIIHYVIPICYFIICTISNYESLKGLISDNYPKDRCSALFVSYILQIVGVIYIYFNMIYFVFKRNDLKEFIDSIDDQNNKLRKPFYDINWKIKLWIGITFFFLFMNAISAVIKYKLNFIYVLALESQISTLISLSFLIYVFLREINQQFRKINDMIKMNDEENIITLKNIIVAMDFHYKIVKISKEAEELFGLPTAMMITFYLICLTLSVHYLLCMLVTKCFGAIFYICCFTVIFLTIHICLIISVWHIIAIQVC